MALTAEELLEIKKALDTPGAIKDESYRTWALEQVQAAEDQNLAGWAGAGGTRADSAPAAPGSLGVKGIIGGEAKPDETEMLAGQLDPRYDLIPQALALFPATTHPGGDEAAKREFQTQGRGDVTFAYEPPVSLVKKQLVDNPAFARMLQPSAPLSLEEIDRLDETSPLYQDAANYMWRETAKAAADSGRVVYRYSKTPWLHGESQQQGGTPTQPSALDQLKLKLGGAGAPLIEASKSFIMGVDNTAALGGGRRAAETLQPEVDVKTPGVDRMGVNENAAQSAKETNDWTIEEHPIAYGLGQLRGATTPLGAAERIFQGVSKGGRFVADAIAKTRLGGLAGPVSKAVGRTALDAAAGGVAAGAEEGGRQLVEMGADAAQTGEAPGLDRLAQAGEAALDVGESGAAFATGGSLLGQGAHGVANRMRVSPQYSSERGPGALGRTEPNMDWRLRRVVTGPKPTGETKSLLDQAARAGDQPGDILAEQIAPKIRDAAAENTKVARGQALAERRNYQSSPEGAGAQPVTYLQMASLEKLRDHHQPGPGGKLSAVDETYRDAQRVFNRHVADVSTEPIEGAMKLTPDEAETFLGSRARYKLIEDDIRAANERSASKGPEAPIERDAYLRTIKDSRERAAADEEIEASIEDIIGDRTPTEAARKKAEQQVLRERVEEEAFVEANGTLADYLRQRGKEAVYVKPAAYDARRTDTLIDGLKDKDLAEAAKLDRQRFKKGGERGGYELMRRGQDEKIAQAEAVEKSVAPGGDAFGPVAGLYNSRPGEKQLVDRVRALADQSGTREQLDRLRGLQETQAVFNRSRMLGPTGTPRNRLSPSTWLDAGQLRAFPVLKALEGPLGPLRGGMAGRAAILGQGTPPPAGEPSARSRYEAARDRRLRELAAEESEEDKRRRRRQEGGRR